MITPKMSRWSWRNGAAVLWPVADALNDLCPVHLRRNPASRKDASIERRVNRARKWFKRGNGDEWQFVERLPLAGKVPRQLVSVNKPVDSCRGPEDMAATIREKRPCRLPAELGLHFTELVEALQFPGRFPNSRKLFSTFAPIQPLGSHRSMRLCPF